ncbi:MAG TPA: Holliday junction resolvase RuvX [Hyphomonadaceae bacterium]|nr:Holliday junction resolvase RuvX [Hyphomonadaceae bacterium]
MADFDLASFKAALPSRGALIGIDPGTQTLGVASSDPDRRIAAPVRTITRSKLAADLAALAEIAQARGAIGFVIGHPLNMNGTKGPASQRASALARQVSAAFGKPVLLWDERLSSAEAERAMIAADLSRAKRAAAIDHAAAAIILQSALDRLNWAG